MHKDGSLVEDFNPWFGRTVIRSCCKLDYGTAQNVIDGNIVIPETDDDSIPESLWPKSRRPTGSHTLKDVANDILLLHSVASSRRKSRFDKSGGGAIAINQNKLSFELKSLSTGEKILGNEIDEKDISIAMSTYPIRDSNRLIEEYMLLANYLVALRFIQIVLERSTASKEELNTSSNDDTQTNEMIDNLNKDLKNLNLDANVKEVEKGDCSYSENEVKILNGEKIAQPIENDSERCLKSEESEIKRKVESEKVSMNANETHEGMDTSERTDYVDIAINESLKTVCPEPYWNEINQSCNNGINETKAENPSDKADQKFGEMSSDSKDDSELLQKTGEISEVSDNCNITQSHQLNGQSESPKLKNGNLGEKSEDSDIDKLRPLIRRHPPPDMHQMSKLTCMLQMSGIEFNASSSAAMHESLQNIQKSSDPDSGIQEVVNSLIAGPMKPAEYLGVDDIQPGLWRHFALNMPCYTHFTSPIRRYADLIVHRYLEAIVSDDVSSIASNEIDDIALQCNKMRANAKAAQERSSVVFLCAYLKRLQPPREPEKGLVVSFGGSGFTVFVQGLGITQRLFLDDIGKAGGFSCKGELSEEKDVLTVIKEGRGLEAAVGESGSAALASKSWRKIEIRALTSVWVVCSVKEAVPVDVQVNFLGPV